MAQLRWLLSMNTNDLKATLFNLLTFLRGLKEPRTSTASKQELPSNSKKITFNIGPSEKHVGLHSFGSISNISDPILDCLRQENQLNSSTSPTRNTSKKSLSKTCRSSECGRGLSEILAIPEAYLNKQISSESLRNYMATDKPNVVLGDSSCCSKLNFIYLIYT